MAQRSFTWRDGERLIEFAPGAIEAAPELLLQHGWERYEMLTTPRALAGAPLALAERAVAVHEISAGLVDELAAASLQEVTTPSLVAFGGGRVIDTAKAIAAVRGGRVAALPTTLSGAEMTAIHRLPKDHSAPHKVRPALVVADPIAMTGLPERRLRASAMNALAHGADSLYTPLANPMSTLAALRGARLIADALDGPLDDDGRAELALGALLTGYAIDSALFALHHVICQTLVRVMDIPHAETNAAILPRAMETMRERAPRELSALARALGTTREEIGARIDELGGGRQGLEALGADRARVAVALDRILAREELRDTPDPPDREALTRLIEAAW